MGDIRTLGNLPEVFMNAINAILILVCGFVYLFWISPAGAGLVIGLILVLLVFYLIRNADIEKDLNINRDLQDDYFRYLNDLLLGFKELKMSLGRNRAIHEDHLAKNREVSRKIRRETGVKYMNNELTGNYSWYVVIGMIIFVLPRLLHLSLPNVSAFLVTVLYLIGPVSVMITLMPFYTNVKIALERLTLFNDKINTGLPDNPRPPEDGWQQPDGSLFPLTFTGVCFDYFDESKQRQFSLGPVDLTINKGELIFITGGNGSGKSTFANLLAGLYRPVCGTVAINDVVLSKDSYPGYRDRISAIFTNNYLFSENYSGKDLSEKNQLLMEYVRTMRLETIIKMIPEKNTISQKLSKGQQKRLAMIYALLDEKELLILDEWAAEQDPGFRGFFYKQFLPSLQAMGKTIVVITHDDEYYPFADRVIKFDYGRIASDSVMEVLAV
jgi:cyclic peptide transporter